LKKIIYILNRFDLSIRASVLSVKTRRFEIFFEKKHSLLNFALDIDRQVYYTLPGKSKYTIGIVAPLR